MTLAKSSQSNLIWNHFTDVCLTGIGTFFSLEIEEQIQNVTFDASKTTSSSLFVTWSEPKAPGKCNVTSYKLGLLYYNCSNDEHTDKIVTGKIFST